MAFIPPPLSPLQRDESPSYMSVKDAMMELKQATLYNRDHAPATVRMPPVWSTVHAHEQSRMKGFSFSRSPSELSTTAPPMRPTTGFPRTEDVPLWATQSNTSSVPGYRSVERPHTTGTALGSGSSLNSPYTYYYGTQPLNPAMSGYNEYSGVGSLSMFGSQAKSQRASSGAFGFGTATRGQQEQLYISPAHLRANLCKYSPGPATYEQRSSFGRQVINGKRSNAAASFGLEERFDADRRHMLACVTPGPGTYRI